MRRCFTLAFLLCALVPAVAQDGIYADFTTSMGSFTCKLHYDRAPRTVANFMALATGERGWLDLATGSANRTPFYDGLTFHRVVSGFVIQGGSRKGDGSDGPGYTFRDEFHPTLRHSQAGVLSMANSGLNSNGSQFFITLAATSFLDDVHSVFGEVTSGLPVVQAIGNVAVDASSKPLTPVTMQSVVIRRVGPDAQAFNLGSQGLPSVGGAGPNMARSGPNFVLQFPRALYSEYQLFDSSNLAAWTRSKVGLYVTPPPIGDLDVTGSATGSAHFYRVAQIAYPGPLFTPPSVAGSTLRLTFTSGASATLTLAFNNAGGGTTILQDASGTSNGSITSYSWGQEAYRGQLVCQSTNLVPLVFSHVYSSAAGGVFKGTVHAQNPFPVAGTFTHSVPTPKLAATSATIETVTNTRAISARTRKSGPRRSDRSGFAAK
jgi:peptidyl-prolyl cis-trans isomerase A (cyclophilin A)